MKFDGIFSLAALFHIPRTELPAIFGKFHDHLLPETGFLLISIPDGNMEQISSNGRWMSYTPITDQHTLLEEAGFEIIKTGKISMYNGNNWHVTLSRRKS